MWKSLFTTLLLASFVAASPADDLSERATGCSPLGKTTTVVGTTTATLTGPFNLQATKSGKEADGTYGHSNYFGAPPSSNGKTQYYLDQTSEIVYIRAGKLFYAVEFPEDTFGGVQFTTADRIFNGRKLTCHVVTMGCKLVCTSGPNAYQCLYNYDAIKPRWRIAANQASNGKICATFVPKVIKV